MRVISGSLKGRRINAKLSSATRPCTDQAKGSLFNFLSSTRLKFGGGCGADLFAGTGSIGYEMISREFVDHVIFVDHYKKCTDFITKQCATFEISESTTIIKSDVFKFIASYNDGQHPHKLDIIFAGAPYGLNPSQYEQIPIVIFEQEILHPDHGLLIVEHDKTISFNENRNFLLHKAFRSTHFSFFSHNHRLI